MSLVRKLLFATRAHNRGEHNRTHERPGSPTSPRWVHRPKAPIGTTTSRKLARLGEALSTEKRKVSPLQVAARILEEAVERIRA